LPTIELHLILRRLTRSAPPLQDGVRVGLQQVDVIAVGRDLQVELRAPGARKAIRAAPLFPSVFPTQANSPRSMVIHDVRLPHTRPCLLSLGSAKLSLRFSENPRVVGSIPTLATILFKNLRSSSGHASSGFFRCHAYA